MTAGRRLPSGWLEAVVAELRLMANHVGLDGHLWAEDGRR